MTAYVYIDVNIYCILRMIVSLRHVGTHTQYEIYKNVPKMYTYK